MARAANTSNRPCWEAWLEPGEIGQKNEGPKEAIEIGDVRPPTDMTAAGMVGGWIGAQDCC